ncbi:MAG: hypothetical protein KDF59_00605 [Nitrosomonas sp.]|nr:hypothetical protein [Nitrosomonas sp.]
MATFTVYDPTVHLFESLPGALMSPALGISIDVSSIHLSMVKRLTSTALILKRLF